MPVTVLAGEQNLLALVDENSQASLGTVSLASGEFTEVATLTDQVENVPATGVTVLTATEMVVLDESLREVARSPWTFPDELAGHSVAAVTGDGGVAGPADHRRPDLRQPVAASAAGSGLTGGVSAGVID